MKGLVCLPTRHGEVDSRSATTPGERWRLPSPEARQGERVHGSEAFLGATASGVWTGGLLSLQGPMFLRRGAWVSKHRQKGQNPVGMFNILLSWFVMNRKSDEFGALMGQKVKSRTRFPEAAAISL